MSHEPTLADQRRMVDALQRQLQASHPARPVERFETHISFVLVAGGWAWKIKKAVAPGFLDFTTIARRREACREELRLNRRLAPALYVDVVDVTGTAAAPALGGTGEAIDCAVRMHAFDQAGLWDRLAARGELTAAHVDELGSQLVAFHREAPVAPADAAYGTPGQVRAPVLDSLDDLARKLPDATDRHAVRTIAQWEQAQFARLEPVFRERRRAGRVRECHGDLHLGNVALVGGRTTVFDCIEFNPDFRWIDVASEIAFIAMDLHAHRLHALAHRLVDRWLERSGDFDAVRVLSYYLVHRALVRAKVMALRAEQAAAEARGPCDHAAARRYLACALGTTRGCSPALLFTHGLSGSGKTSASQQLVEKLGVVRVRSDVERKRLAGLEPAERSGSAVGGGLYDAQATERTYARLFEIAAGVIDAGMGVVLDATFLQRTQRDAARRLARTAGVPWAILALEVDAQTLRDRVRRRAERGGDASEAGLAVLERQLASAEPLDEDERDELVRCRPGSPDAGAPVIDWEALQQRLSTCASR